MNYNREWRIAEPDLDTVLIHHQSPLDALAAGSIPAIVLRGVYSAEWCHSLVDRLIDLDLLFDPARPTPEHFQRQAIPEGYYREGRSSMPRQAWAQVQTHGERTRIDIGTSLGYRGSDKEAFLAHSQETQDRFRQLFPSTDDPVAVLYERLEALSVNKRVVTAYEPDGRQYGPAIIRAHYGGYTYKPHFDSVRLREKRSEYAVSEFDHQFAGVLVLQNTQLADATAQCVIHRCLWQPDVDPHLRAGSFHEYAREKEIESVEVCLEPGDLYFFNTRAIHEVPGVAGETPRVVLATFIGYSADRDEIFVWA